MSDRDRWLEAPAHPSDEWCVGCNTKTDNGKWIDDKFVCADCQEDK